MTEAELRRLLLLVAEIWPSYPLPEPDQLQTRVEAWGVVLDDMSYEEAVAGVRLIARDGDPFPPAPGQVVARFSKERERLQFGELMKTHFSR